MRDSGDGQGAVRLVNHQLTLQPPNAALYQLIAGIYEASGDHGKANEMRDRAAKLAPPQALNQVN
jgi:Flp pilus assembly protein TadD